MMKKQLPSLLILSMIAGLVYLTPFLRFSFYDQMKEALQISDLQIGSLGFIYGLFNVLGYIPTGFIAEKFSTKKMLILS
ncbi:MAG: MFS transporter, partial [Lachnospiraceae bacterium]|nr:MFS transporter [Lachnospiraceae bacterium]